MSYDRILPLVDPENILVVTNRIYAPLIKEQLPGLNDGQILCEPARRNTAPCIAWAANHIHAIDPEATMVVTPSDHIVTRENIFADCINKGFDFVERHNALLTLGISPTRPETGYGYIQIGQETEPGLLKVKAFTEKPDIDLAKIFLETGEFLWNSGIFLWKASSIIEALENHSPELAMIFEKGRTLMGTPDENTFIDTVFPTCPSISIDYAVMEKASNVYVERVSFGWSDLGTWGALYDISPKNREQNVTQECNVLAYDSTGNIFAVNNREKLIVAKDLNGYVIADADDVLLIYPRGKEQEIRNVVDDTRIAFGDKFI